MSDPRDPGDRLEELLTEHRDDPEPQEEAPFDPFAPLPVSQAADEAEDADALPDAPLFQLLRTLEEDITVDRIDRVWIFPPRRIEAGETAVVVVSAFPEASGPRRRVYAAHYTVLEDGDQRRLAVDEFGEAPEERVGRMVEEVVERIKDAPAGAPRGVHVGGDDERWAAMMHELAEQFLEERLKGRRGKPSR